MDERPPEFHLRFRRDGKFFTASFTIKRLRFTNINTGEEVEVDTDPRVIGTLIIDDAATGEIREAWKDLMKRYAEKIVETGLASMRQKVLERATKGSA